MDGTGSPVGFPVVFGENCQLSLFQNPAGADQGLMKQAPGKTG
jgi:hypothetical protein